MKAVIFAGGVGTRLWPLSRKKSPKQFEKVVGEKSTLQLAAEKLLPEFKWSDIFVSTGTAYIDLVKEQLPLLPYENIIGEPAKRDVGPAVGMVMGYMAKKFPKDPVIILWSDHLVKKIDTFKNIILSSGKFVEKFTDKVVFIGQKPRFASDNLGWIKYGAEVAKDKDTVFLRFEGFSYRPNAQTAEMYFKSAEYCWNLGYFVAMPKHFYNLFKKLSPEIYRISEKIINAENFEEFSNNLNNFYSEMPEVSFDNAVLERIDTSSAVVVMEDIGWSDVGAWEALKEALEHHQDDNIIKGRVLLENATDTLVYNYQDSKIIVGVNINDLLVINTDDVLLVADKKAVKEIKKIVEGFKGTENEGLT
jgi:mannose-1-phosphate guanylyltransferase